LRHLDDVATSNDINEIRSGIRAAATKITADVQQMRTSNQLAIAQFKDEIRLLHQEIQTMQRSLQPQNEEQNPARRHLYSHMEELTRRGRPFSVLLAVIRNLEGLKNCHSPKVLEIGLDTFKARFESRLPGLATVARWNENQFAAGLDIESAAAIAISRELMRTLSAPIVEQADGALQTLVFDAITGSIHFSAGADPVELQTKITQLVAALTGRAR
jgi:GGDEF domain-containing protein